MDATQRAKKAKYESGKRCDRLDELGPLAVIVFSRTLCGAECDRNGARRVKRKMRDEKGRIEKMRRRDRENGCFIHFDVTRRRALRAASSCNVFKQKYPEMPF